MPKKGPSDSQWKHKLKLYASKELTFSTGQHPSKESTWGKEKQKVDNCPLSKASVGSKDLFGRDISCKCGYHIKEV